MDGNQGLNFRPQGTKAAKDAHKAAKTRDGVLYAQAVAIEVMAAAAVHKAALLEEHNLILLMTAPDVDGQPTTTAQELLALCQAEELRKLKSRLVEDTARELAKEAARVW